MLCKSMHCCSEGRKKASRVVLGKIGPNNPCCPSPWIPALALRSQIFSHLRLRRLPCLINIIVLPQRLCSAHFKNGYLAKICTAMRLYVPCSAQPAPGDNPSPVFLQKPSAPMASHQQCRHLLALDANNSQTPSDLPTTGEPKVGVNSFNTAPPLETC